MRSLGSDSPVFFHRSSSFAGVELFSEWVDKGTGVNDARFSSLTCFLRSRFYVLLDGCSSRGLDGEEEGGKVL